MSIIFLAIGILLENIIGLNSSFLIFFGVLLMLIIVFLITYDQHISSKKIPILELIQMREEDNDELWVGIGKEEDHG